MSTSVPMALVTPVLGLLLGVPGAEASRPVPGVSDHTAPAASPTALRYWTADRMRHAVPPPRAPVAGPGSGAAGTGERAVAGLRAATPAARAVIHATTGKVFFTIDGGDYVCSAGTVNSANRDLVVTAGHCAVDSAGNWALNWVYVPGYDRGARPYGVFAARRLFVASAWSARGDENYDVALVALATDQGRHVADVAGTHNIAFDQPRGGTVYGFGFPSGGRYDGERLTYCAGRTHPDAHRITQDEGLRCDMTEGASGGPWMTRFDARTGTGLITSVSSFKYADDPTTMYGPYFGEPVRRLYDAAQRA